MKRYNNDNANFVSKKKPYKKTYTKTSGYKKQASMNAYQVKQIVKSTLKPEVKYVDTWDNNKPLLFTDTWFLLNGITAGASQWQRIGNSVSMKSVHLRIYFHPNEFDLQYNATWESPTNLRILLMLDRMLGTSVTSGGLITYPIWSEVIQNRSAGGTTESKFGLETNIPNKSRFKILRDWSKYFPRRYKDQNGSWQQDNAVGVGENVNWCIDEYIKLKGSVVDYDPSVSGLDVSMVKKNSLYLVIYSDTENAVTINRSARLAYNDN